jgi:DNA-binding MarR family transcriptional regulator
MEGDWIDSTLDRWAALQPDLAADVYQVTGRISRIAARLAQRQEEVFGRHGLNRGDVGVLSALRTSPTPKGLSPTQLMRGLMLSSAGITKRLDSLEQRGLLRRQPHPEDRRAVSVQITDAGRRLVTKAVTENTRQEAGVLTGLTAKERRLLAELLRKVLGRIEPSTGG